MIAVTGATGQLGRIVIKKLSERVPSTGIAALVRDVSKAGNLGVPVRLANYSEPATLDAALAGVDKLLLISGSEVGSRARQHANVIEAAKRAGVGLLAYTSILHADVSPISLAEEHRATEAAIQASGIPFVILRNSWYTENYTSSIPGALAGGAFIGCAGDGRISSATRQDFADAAVAVLTSDGHAGRVYELAGDVAYTLTDFAAEISRQAGKPVPYRNLSEPDYAKTLEGFGLPAALAAAIASWETGAARDALYDDSQTLSKLIGHPTTPLAQAISDSLKS